MSRCCPELRSVQLRFVANDTLATRAPDVVERDPRDALFETHPLAGRLGRELAKLFDDPASKTPAENSDPKNAPKKEDGDKTMP